MNEENKKATVIGKATFINFDEFVKWCKTEEADSFFALKNLWTDTLYALQGEIPGVNVSNLFEITKKNGSVAFSGFDNRTETYIKSLAKYCQYIDAFSSEECPVAFDLLYEHEKFDIVAFGNSQFLIPSGFLIKTPYKDYSDTPIGQLYNQLNGHTGSDYEANLIPINTRNSQLTLTERMVSIEDHNRQMAVLTASMDDVKNARVGELAELQAEIDRQMAILQAKKDKLLEELNEKKQEMELVKQKLELELFLLESEIYSIRCFLGEVVDFIKIRSGSNAPEESPIYLFQKIRFLDEELGKAVSFYDFDFADAKIFENLLKNRSDAVEMFCPTEKCVTLVRVSKTGKAFGYLSTPYGPMLSDYNVYHGKKIGIMVRNGENLYLGWTDEDKINIPDDMFFTPYTKEMSEEESKAFKPTPIKEAVSRYFVFAILQGLLENRKVLTLPEGVKVRFPNASQYVVCVTADTWLSDNRYGSFSDIVNKANSKISVGDHILALESLSDGHWNSGGWGGQGRFDYSRDRNYSRRTRDVHFTDGQIYKINLIEDAELYVSLKKNGSDYVYRNGDFQERKRDAYANFLVYKDEFINLTYMNSVWLEYVITNRNLGSSGRMGNYAEVIRYLNKALEFVRKRESAEKPLIEKYYPELEKIEDWPVKLSEWKLEKDVRNITEFQAKRFAKFLAE